MDHDFSAGGGDQSFEFAFNSSVFSDRVLWIEIVSENGDGCDRWARHGKRRRRHGDARKGKEFYAINSELNLRSNQPDVEAVSYENCDDEAEVMSEESPSGEDHSQNSDSSWGVDYSPVVQVKSIFISSVILAAKSPFFYKLFSNGMRESDQRHANLHINASEEASLMEVLHFMYSGKLSVTSAPLVLDVMMTADKFEVASCMRYCCELLRNLPMTPESALLYLELPTSMASAVHPLTDAAKEFLVTKYRDITKFQEEMMNLPLSGVEAILSSDDLQVTSEDVVYDFVLKWVRAKYPSVEDRREILSSRLIRLVRFPFMSCRKLKRALACNELEHEISTKAVLGALFIKSETPHRQLALPLEVSSSRSQFVERAYKYRPVKVIEFELPRPQCIIYLDLKREECAGLFPNGRVHSQAFHLAGQGFFLSAQCTIDQQQPSFHCFGLFLGMQEKGSVSFTVDYEFSARARPSVNFVNKLSGVYTFTGGKAVGYRNLFAIPWASLMADDSPYFIDNVLYLRAELTLKQPLLHQPCST